MADWRYYDPVTGEEAQVAFDGRGAWRQTHRTWHKLPLESFVSFGDDKDLAYLKEHMGKRPTEPNEELPSNLPAGAKVKGDWGDIGLMRQREARKLGGFKVKNTPTKP